jgi:uncharacterized cupredoxin-like copper-binding protein
MTRRLTVGVVVGFVLLVFVAGWISNLATGQRTPREIQMLAIEFKGTFGKDEPKPEGTQVNAYRWDPGTLVARKGETLSLAIPATSAGAGETEITLVMGQPNEFAFAPAEIMLKNGSTIKLIVKNVGQVKHELMSDLFQWIRDVKIEIEGVAEFEVPSIYEIEVEPGKEVIVEFKLDVVEHILEEKGGKAEFEFGCFIKDHYKAGMKGTFVVEGKGH